MRRKLLASTSNSVCPPVNRRAAWPEMTTRGMMLFRSARQLVRVDCGAQPRRRHRQVAHADADRVGDGVGDRGHRWHDRYLADTPGTEGVARVGVLHDDDLDHGAC